MILIDNIFNELYYVLHIIILSLHGSCECVNVPAELSSGCLLLSVGHFLNVDEANPHLKPAAGQDCPAAQITMVTRLGFTLTTLMELESQFSWMYQA